jgi:hypothetical protein
MRGALFLEPIEYREKHTVQRSENYSYKSESGNH